MTERKKELHPVEYNYIAKHNPYFMTKQLKPSHILNSFFTKSDDVINIEFDEFYTDAEKLRDDIATYIQQEKHLYCEAIDLNHLLIDGKRYVLNVTHGITTPEGSLWGTIDHIVSGRVLIQIIK
jgi:hypothetical protein